MTRYIEIALCCEYYYPIGEAIKYKKLFKYASKYDLIDRLYRRYVRYEDINATRELVSKVFDEISFNTALRNDFIDAYDKCINTVERRIKEKEEHYGGRGRSYCPPSRIVNVTGVNTDTSPIPDYMWYISEEGELPLKEYDNLEGNPFWMRPEYLDERVIANKPHEMLVTKEARRLYGFEDVSLELLKKLGIPVVD